MAEEFKWIIYVGTNRLRDNDIFNLHGLNFKKGEIYKVTPAVWEYVKALRGFEACNGIGSDKIIDFPTKKKAEIAKSFVSKWDEERKRRKRAKAIKK